MKIDNVKSSLRVMAILTNQLRVIVLTGVFIGFITGAFSGTALAAPEPVRQSLAELDAAIAAAKKELNSLQKTHATNTQTRSEELKKLASKLLQTEISTVQRERELGQLEARVPELQSQLKLANSSWRANVKGFKQSFHGIKQLLSEQPGTKALRQDLSKQIKILSAAGAAQSNASNDQFSDKDYSATAQAVGAGLKTVLVSRQQAQQIRLESVELFDATGTKQTVELCSIGSIMFAYRANNHLALCLASPRDASSYRWTTDLPVNTKSQLAAMFEQVKAGQPAQVVIDPTRQLTAHGLPRARSAKELVNAGGWVMYPLIGVAVLALLFALERWVYFLGQGFSARAFLHICHLARDGQFSAAANELNQPRKISHGLLSSLLSQRQRGQKAMENAVQEQLLYYYPKLNARLGGLSVLAAVAPLLGLLGTVTGIIQTFGVIRRFGNANPGMLAGGISEALITTATGLVVAIPILLVHSLLVGQQNKILADAEKYAATLLNLLVSESSTDSATDSAPMPAPDEPVAPIPAQEPEAAPVPLSAEVPTNDE